MSEAREITGIQYLRGYAAAAVVVAHANGMLGADKYSGVRPLGEIKNLGGTGVVLFFLISGFIMPYIALRPRSLAPATTTSEFLWRRFARVVPFLWVCIVAWVALRVAGRGPAAWTEYWPGYLRAFVLWPTGFIDPPQAWTLRHEMFFYLLFSCTLMSWRGRFLPLLFWILSPLLLLPFMAPSPVHRWDLLSVLAHSSNLLFGFGLLCGYTYLRFPRLFAVSVPGGSLTCLILWILAICVATTWRIKGDFSDALILGAICLPLVYAGICSKPSRYQRIDRAAYLIGDASYSIYMIHGIVIASSLSVAALFVPWADPFALLVFCLVASIALGIWVHRNIELPLVRFFKRLGRSRGTAQTEPHPS